MPLLIALALFLGLRAWQLRGAAEGSAPAVSGPDVTTGQRLALSTEGPTLVYFWATWCGVCNAVDPNVQRVARDHHVIAIATRSGADADVAAFLREHEYDFPSLNDPRGLLAREYGVRAFPTSFWVGADGEIRHREVGYTSTLGFLARLGLANL